jgi:hypothetical protein
MPCARPKQRATNRPALPSLRRVTAFFQPINGNAAAEVDAKPNVVTEGIQAEPTNAPAKPKTQAEAKGRKASTRRKAPKAGSTRKAPTARNPIEQAFSKIKHWLRLAQKRTIDDTWGHFGDLVATIQPSECTNYFANAGYASVNA